jgi:ATP-dependent DNA helicase RecG
LIPEPLDQARVESLKGVGPALAGKLARIGISNLQDVLFHLPLRYEDRTRITPIGAAQLGSTIVIEGQVVACEIAFGKRRSLLAYVQDNTGTIALRFYHFSKAQQNNLKNAPSIRCYGEVRRGAAGYEIYHPEYSTKLDMLEDRLTPIYPVTEGVTQQRYRTMVKQVLQLMSEGKVLRNLGSEHQLLSKVDINTAIDLVHNPSPETELSQLQEGIHPAQKRLAFEELLAHHLSMRLIRQEMLSLQGIALPMPASTYKQLITEFGFELTKAQLKVASEISLDMNKSVPMLRLLQGDVGSGKTVIAAMASVHASESQYQAAIMAPTEILAEQHFINFSNWLNPLGIETVWLSGKVKGKKREEHLGIIGSGNARVVIGTHALFQNDVVFKNLGLVIIDEQHRFGVHQRLALREKGEYNGVLPHQLVMTATPIPRTLTMSLYADMDCSVIDELPPGRSPITTSVLADNRREEVIDRIESACSSGAQAYWVCTLIDDSEVIQCQAAESTAEQLTSLLPEIEIGLIHGRMSANDKTKVMSEFKTGSIDLLVATTVIEVGVDVPNASLMVIENPERLGLAQLHQLRGRIGRGSTKSFCVLLYHPPLGELSKQRLNVMRESQDGFFIAEQDLQIRGPGELFGSRQSGAMQFKLADLLRDNHMLKDVRLLADDLLASDRTTAFAIMDRWLTMPEKLSQV